MVGYEVAVERCDHDALVSVSPVHGDLVDRRIHRLGFFFHELEHRQLLVDADVTPGDAGLIQIARAERVERLWCDLAATRCDRRGSACSGQHRRHSEIFSERIARLFANNDAQADTLLDA